jgi:hypothetical protein
MHMRVGVVKFRADDQRKRVNAVRSRADVKPLALTLRSVPWCSKVAFVRDSFCLLHRKTAVLPTVAGTRSLCQQRYPSDAFENGVSGRERETFFIRCEVKR